MAKKSKLVFLFAAFLIIAGCANQMSPEGGEIDTQPPTILDVFPKDGTTNFKENYLEIDFSEWVEKQSAQDAVFISPALKHRLEFDWSGKTLTVTIKDTLQENTTYTVTVGTDVADINNRNKMASSFVFAFSTGNKIDKGKILGKVFTSKNEGVLIFAYQTDNEVDPTKQKPNYISQIGSNGQYSLVGLRNGNYKIFSVRDKLRDLIYQKNEDEIGFQFKKLILSDEIIELNENNFMLSSEDTIKPNLSKAFMPDRNHLIVEFSKAIDSSKLSNNNFHLYDSTTQNKIVPSYFYKGDARANQFVLGFTDTTSFANYLLHASNIQDMFENVTPQDKIAFIYKADKDTLVNKLTKAAGYLPDGKMDFEQSLIKIDFADALTINDVKERISVVDDKKVNQKILVDRIDDASFNIRIDQKIKPATDYTVLFNAKGLKDQSNKNVDTVYKQIVKANSELDFSGVSGTVESIGDSTSKVIVLETAALPKRVYSQKSVKNKFDIKKVIPGKYLIWSFTDDNGNGKYDHGKINPFKHSEKFVYYPDTLNLRARWPVGDVKIEFKK